MCSEVEVKRPFHKLHDVNIERENVRYFPSNIQKLKLQHGRLRTSSSGCLWDSLRSEASGEATATSEEAGDQLQSHSDAFIHRAKAQKNQPSFSLHSVHVHDKINSLKK